MKERKKVVVSGGRLRHSMDCVISIEHRLWTKKRSENGLIRHLDGRVRSARARRSIKNFLIIGNIKDTKIYIYS